jgi:hypothetical protein
MHTATKNRLLQTKKARSLDSTIAKVRKHNYDQAVDHTVIHVEKKKNSRTIQPCRHFRKEVLNEANR